MLEALRAGQGRGRCLGSTDFNLDEDCAPVGLGEDLCNSVDI